MCALVIWGAAMRLIPSRNRLPPKISKLLGHSSTETTERYAHLNDSNVAEAAETVGADIFRLLGVIR